MVQGAVVLDGRSCHLEPISQYLSFDVHLSDHLPRVTQTNIDQYYVADLTPKDDWPTFIRIVSKSKKYHEM
jgi:hypothetical protein